MTWWSVHEDLVQTMVRGFNQRWGWLTIWVSILVEAQSMIGWEKALVMLANNWEGRLRMKVRFPRERDRGSWRQTALTGPTALVLTLALALAQYQHLHSPNQLSLPIPALSTLTVTQGLALTLGEGCWFAQSGMIMMTNMLMPAMMKSERRRWLRWGGASAEMAVVATSKATDREDEEGRHGKVCIEHQDQIKKTSYKENWRWKTTFTEYCLCHRDQQIFKQNYQKYCKIKFDKNWKYFQFWFHQFKAKPDAVQHPALSRLSWRNTSGHLQRTVDGVRGVVMVLAILKWQDEGEAWPWPQLAPQLANYTTANTDFTTPRTPAFVSSNIFWPLHSNVKTVARISLFIDIFGAIINTGSGTIGWYGSPCSQNWNCPQHIVGGLEESLLHKE